MLNKSQAKELASEWLRQNYPRQELMITDEYTVERPLCWVFEYQSREYVETREFSSKLLGTGLLFVNRSDGTVEHLNGRCGTDELIAQYEGRLSEQRKQ